MRFRCCHGKLRLYQTRDSCSLERKGGWDVRARRSSGGAGQAPGGGVGAAVRRELGLGQPLSLQLGGPAATLPGDAAGRAGGRPPRCRCPRALLPAGAAGKPSGPRPGRRRSVRGGRRGVGSSEQCGRRHEAEEMGRHPTQNHSLPRCAAVGRAPGPWPRGALQPGLRKQTRGPTAAPALHQGPPGTPAWGHGRSRWRTQTSREG